MIEFDELTHTYRMSGVVVPSVTQVLADVRLIDLSMVPEHFLEKACEFGGIVHKATEYHDTGVLDETSIDDAVRGHVSGWAKFILDHSVQIFDIEMRVFSKKFKFAGTLDRIAMINDRLCVIDLKSGSKQKAYACQTAAYAFAYNEMTGEKIRDRYCVYLSEGTYKLEKHTDKLDENMFLNALSLYNYKRRP